MKLPTEGQQGVRVVAQRGKSMEELGASKLKLSSLSRSFEQLDQLWKGSTGPGGMDQDKSNVSNFAEIRDAQGQHRNVDQVAKESEIFGQKNTQRQMQKQTQKMSLLKQNSDPQEDPSVGTKSSSRSPSPTSFSSSRTRVYSGFQGTVTDVSMSSRPPSETLSNPTSPRALETSEREIKSTSLSPTLTRLPFENGPNSR